MPRTDPVMAVLDRLPLSSPHAPLPHTPLPRPPEQPGPLPFGLRFAVTPIRAAGKHGKTYRTVNDVEATHINQDGTTVVYQDPVQREEED